ncbi:MAG: L,D-transpeptidase family protein [Bradymonadales bacterium]|nr:L,D-transpeptidase family protein [Bradymonadales bacterium]
MTGTAIALILSACADSGPTVGDGDLLLESSLLPSTRTSSPQEQQVLPQRSPRDQWLAELRESIPQELPDRLSELALSQAAGLVITQTLEQQRELPINTYRRTLLAELYTHQGHRSVFLDRWSAPGYRANLLLGEVRSAHQQGLNAGPYHLDQLDQLEQQIQGLEPLVPVHFSLDEPMVEALAEQALSLGAIGDNQEVLDALARQVAGLEEGGPETTELSEVFAAAVEQLKPALRERVQFEVVLCDAYLSYARDMRLGNVSRLTPEQLRQGGGRGQITADRFRETFAYLASSSEEEFAHHLEWLYPTHPQYSLLMASLARYRAIVEAGGWDRVPPRSLQPGSRHSRVAQLKERLAIEGFYQGPIDNHYDEATERAVRSYQESHQMEVTGATHTMFWSSLNIPAEQRLAQIGLALERWRESRIDYEPYYVFVNIPDFHAEVWRNGQREMRFKVVVGNNQRECNPQTGTMELVNATPMFHAEIEYLVFNPYWYVPDRIRRDELDVEIIENPAWLQENGYEVALIEGVYRIRQLPGEENALGLVKFMLPNPFNVYMHDTPRKQYFRFPIRAFSHGCMRVENPMAYAEYLLSNSGQWDPERIQRILDSRVETTIILDQPVPIFVEYYVVTVDDQGRTNFLADIYQYDRDRLAPSPPTPVPCGPAIAATGESQVEQPPPTVNWQNDGVAVLPDGTILRPDGTIEFSPERLAAMAQPEQSEQNNEQGLSTPRREQPDQRSRQQEAGVQADQTEPEILPDDHGP